MPEQSARNHAAVDPLHMAILFVLFINFVVTAVNAYSVLSAIHSYQVPAGQHLNVPAIATRLIFNVLVTIALFLVAYRTRANALKVQDRVIRLEERIRMAAILPEPLLSQSHALTPDQYIGLRFASDRELPDLVERTLAENLTRKQIKAAIQNWRPDTFRL